MNNGYPFKTDPKHMGRTLSTKIDWCKKQYGHMGDRWQWSWDHVFYMPIFYFKEEKDLTWFILNWS